MATDKLEPDRRSGIGEPAGQSDRGTAGHVERTGETQQGLQHPGILAEACHLRGGERRDALRRHQQQVDILEYRGDASPERRPTEDDLLILEARQAPAQFNQAAQRRAVFRFAGRIGRLMRDGGLDAAGRKPVADRLLDVGERHLANIRAKIAYRRQRGGHRVGRGGIDPDRVPRMIDADTQSAKSAGDAGEIVRHAVLHRGGVIAIAAGDRVPSNAPQPAALRAMGPMWSSVAASSNTPWRLTRPQVGLRPVTPLAAQGKRIDPPVSDPSEP